MFKGKKDKFSETYIMFDVKCNKNIRLANTDKAKFHWTRLKKQETQNLVIFHYEGEEGCIR